MTDRLTPEQRRLNMSRIRGQDTRPEIIVRRALHAQGYRFRLHRSDLPGKPDIVLPRWGVALFVHGCFWHMHECDLFRWPATRVDFWRKKIEANADRDKKAADELLARGWKVLTIWECALKGKNRLSAESFSAALNGLIRSSAPHSELVGKNKTSP